MSTNVVDQQTVTLKTEATPTEVSFPVTLTERAAREVKTIIAGYEASGSAEKMYLRLSVRGGGCSGFQNKLDLDHVYNEKVDLLSEQHGVSLIVDKKSLLYLDGAVVDFHEDLNARGFKISNPNAKTTCGCGSSFSM